MTLIRKFYKLKKILNQRFFVNWSFMTETFSKIEQYDFRLVLNNCKNGATFNTRFWGSEISGTND